MREPDYQEIEDINLGLRDATRLKKIMFSNFNPDLDIVGLNSTHYRTLLIIRERESECMKRICCQIGLEAGSFTPVADRLIEEGLVERISDSHDRRRSLLKLTEQGESFVEELKVLMRNHLSECFSLLDDELYKEFTLAMRTFSKVNHILQEK